MTLSVTLRLKQLLRELENTNEQFGCDEISTSKHAHTYSTRKMCSPDAEEYAPALQSVQLTLFVDPEIRKSFMSSLHWHSFGAGHRQV